MFARFKIECARLTPATHLDIVRLILALGDIVKWQVGNARERILQLGAERLFTLFERGHIGFDLRHFGLERLGGFGVALAHGLADRL